MDKERFKKATQIDRQIEDLRKAKNSLECNCFIVLERETRCGDLSRVDGLREVMVAHLSKKIEELEEQFNLL